MRTPTKGPHFLVDPGDIDREGATAILRADQAHHLAVVLRARPGDPVSLADGTGALWQARVRRSDEGRVTLALVTRQVVAPPRPRLTVVHALPRRRKLDEVIQRLSELGVDRVVPVHSERSQVRLPGEKAAGAVARWRSVALAAAKQSRRVRPLQVAEVGRWSDLTAPAGCGVVLWEQATTGLRAVLDGLNGAAGDELVLAVGPEGGLTPAEVKACGLPAASLGPTVLRTETAALVAASAVLYHVGRLG
ncbi:MAG: 16S rRNA (uracil(1498)-N(3))-methyltransferase [Actinomycetota bacterium]|nr:16S rRNA (uracil(1498)-N(3))-methyltransferase [Actinomycetota bacterium]